MGAEGQHAGSWDDELLETDLTARRVIGFLDLGTGEDWAAKDECDPLGFGPRETPPTESARSFRLDLHLPLECKLQRASHGSASTEDRSSTGTQRSLNASEERLSPGGSPARSPSKDDACVDAGREPDEAGEERTTLMVRNIPRKYTQRQFLNDLQALYRLPDAGCDFFYLPADLGSGRNLGYAFLNFLTPAEAARFKAHFHKLHLYPAAKSGLSVGYAVVQGLERNLANIRRSSVYRIKNPEFRPLVLHAGQLVPVAIPR